MRIDREYHHFKGEHLTRCEWVERFVVDALVQTSVSDADRESSQAWELMHSSTCKAFMHVLAEKRGVDVELSRVAGALHDYYVIKTGKYRNHAQLGVPLVREVLGQNGGFSGLEVDFVCEMVANHSDKHVYSELPHVELVKDADVFDCSLYYGTEFYYLTRKPLPVCHEYFARVLRVREELGMPLPSAYRCLSRAENGPLCDMGEPVRAGGDERTPTAAVLALWALASSPEAQDWPVILVRNDGSATRWYGAQRFVAGRATGPVPSWEVIADVKQSTARRLSEGMAHARDANVRDLLCSCQGALIPTWNGYGASASARRRAAEVLCDFDCDPKGDAKLANDIARRVSAKLEGGTDEKLGCTPLGWDLDRVQMDAIDELARLHALATIRGDVVHASHRMLSSTTGPAGRDLVFQLPSRVFGCEEVPGVNNVEDSWLAVAWPRFERFEFVVGNEADDRFAALADYFKDERAGG